MHLPSGRCSRADRMVPGGGLCRLPAHALTAARGGHTAVPAAADCSGAHTAESASQASAALRRLQVSSPKIGCTSFYAENATRWLPSTPLGFLVQSMADLHEV